MHQTQTLSSLVLLSWVASTLGTFSSIALVFSWAAPSLASDTEHISSLPLLPSEMCSSSPLIEAQALLAAGQCRGMMPDNNATKHTPVAASPKSKPDATAEAEEAEEAEDSSGGWSGPHSCAGAYCVYSHSTFAAGRGIVIISDGGTAQTLANLPVFRELASPEASRLLASANINVKSEGIETRHIPGKGRGLVATRAVHRGEQIMAYTPALVIHRRLVDELGRDEQLRVLRDAVSRLPEATRMAFWKQLGREGQGQAQATHQHGHDEDSDDILDIIMNNSFNLPLTADKRVGPFIGNFPEVSMYNHDCRPNTAYQLDHGLVHRTHAVRRSGAGAGAGVQPGEELSISYVDPLRARSVRRGRTQRNWGFACACAQCSLPEALANASDNRLWRIHEVEASLVLESVTRTDKAGRKTEREKLQGGGGGGGGTDYLGGSELLLSLYGQERLLESHGASAYRVAALNYNAYRRAELATKYALLALEAGILEDGARSEGVKEMVGLLEAPEGHWSWGRRVGGV